ncbi:YfiR family protein [Beggiatoa alba]|nr:YfiR family protein [Beggiatoa alba]
MAMLFLLNPLLISVLPAYAEPHKLEAEYLLRITQFVTWSPQLFTDPTAPLEICVLDDAHFQKSLENVVKGRKIGYHPIISRLENNIYKLSTCHIVYITTAGDADRVMTILNSLKNKSVLLVSNIPHFIDQGGNLGFIYQKHGIFFEINYQSLNMKGLTLSSKLLRQALRVIK